MNDFTKEELKILRRLTLHHLDRFRENSDCIELTEKIRCMIDNYCEHDNVKSLSDADYVYRCSDCDKIVGYK